MKEGKKLDLGLTGLDKLFSTEQERVASQFPKIYDIPLAEIDDFPDHPYKVKEDEDMDQLVPLVRLPQHLLLEDLRPHYRTCLSKGLLRSAFRSDQPRAVTANRIPFSFLLSYSAALPQTGWGGLAFFLQRKYTKIK